MKLLSNVYFILSLSGVVLGAVLHRETKTNTASLRKALSFAVMQNNLELVHDLLEKYRADVDPITLKTVFYEATNSSCCAIMKKVLPELEEKLDRDTCVAALKVAAINRDSVLMNYLLENNDVDQSSLKAVLAEALNSYSFDIVYSLLRKITETLNHDFLVRVLKLAAFHGKLEYMEELLRNYNVDQDTLKLVLLEAVNHYRFNIIEWLLPKLNGPLDNHILKLVLIKSSFKGNVDLLEMFFSQYVVDQDTLVAVLLEASKYNRINVIKTILPKLKGALEDVCLAKVLSCLAFNGELELFEDLFRQNYERMKQTDLTNLLHISSTSYYRHFGIVKLVVTKLGMQLEQLELKSVLFAAMQCGEFNYMKEMILSHGVLDEQYFHELIYFAEKNNCVEGMKVLVNGLSNSAKLTPYIRNLILEVATNNGDIDLMEKVKALPE